MDIMVFSGKKTVKVIVFGMAGLWSFHFSSWIFTYIYSISLKPRIFAPEKWWLEEKQSFPHLGWFLLGANSMWNFAIFVPQPSGVPSDASLPPSFQSRLPGRDWYSSERPALFLRSEKTWTRRARLQEKRVQAKLKAMFRQGHLALCCLQSIKNNRTGRVAQSLWADESDESTARYPRPHLP